MELTKNGVCYNIKESPFTYTWRGMTYFFSSEKHRSKFVHRVLDREEWLDDSLSRRFRCTVHLPILTDIQLYTMVESRGFYIQTDDGAEYENAQSVYVEANMTQLGVTYGQL